MQFNLGLAAFVCNPANIAKSCLFLFGNTDDPAHHPLETGDKMGQISDSMIINFVFGEKNKLKQKDEQRRRESVCEQQPVT